jgi:hypothetical protein
VEAARVEPWQPPYGLDVVRDQIELLPWVCEKKN